MVAGPDEVRSLIRRIEGDLARLKSLLDPAEPAEPESRPEEWLTPCQLADRLGIGEPYARKLIQRGLQADLGGFRKAGGRLYATPDALASLRP